jgi:ribulose-phosphate 3-epimerase
MSIQINPSILSADFANFENEFKTIESCDNIHVDVMDGHFVEQITFGVQMVKRMVEIAARPLDVHLMIEDADNKALEYAHVGAQSVTFHFEAAKHPILLAREIRRAGAKVGIAVRPGTPLDSVLGQLSEFDMVLVMTVEPGRGGQKLIEHTLEKVIQARQAIDQSNSNTLLQVDGGIDLSNIGHVASCGADTFVAGSAVFSASDRNVRINELRVAAEQAFRISSR